MDKKRLKGIKKGLLALHTLELMAVNIYRFQITKEDTELNRQLIAAMCNEMTHFQDFQVKLYEYGMKRMIPNSTRAPGLTRVGKTFGQEDLIYAGTGAKEGKHPGWTSCGLPYSGYFAMRTSWKPEALFCLFDCGPLGEAFGFGDMLSVTVAAHGRTIVPHDGRSYYSSDGMTRYFLGSRNANTIMIDGTLPADGRAFTLSSVQLDVAPKVNSRAIGYVPTIPMRPLKVAPILIVIGDGLVACRASSASRNRQRA